MNTDNCTVIVNCVVHLTITADFQLVNIMAYGNGEVNQHRLWEMFFSKPNAGI